MAGKSKKRKTATAITAIYERTSRSGEKTWQVKLRTAGFPAFIKSFATYREAEIALAEGLLDRAERTIKAPWTAVGDLTPAFTPAECADCFEAAGYETAETGCAPASAYGRLAMNRKPPVVSSTRSRFSSALPASFACLTAQSIRLSSVVGD